MLVEDIVRLGQLIHNIDIKMIAKQNKNLTSMGVTVQQGLILIYLYVNKDKKITQKMLEVNLNITNPTVTNTIKVMMNKNLVYKIKDNIDKRKYYLYLTPYGLELAPKCGKIMEATDREAYKNFSEKELKLLVRLLEKVRI